ncbi:MAG: methyltransferase [bacterium]|nr:methyltransferase [bacterium]
MKSAKRKTEDFECKVRSFNIKLKIPPKVFKPTLDSFLLAGHVKIKLKDRVLDMGCGSGFVGIVAAKLGAGEVTASDINPHAVACGRANARLNGVEKKFQAIQSDLFQKIPKQKFDVIVFNPPFSSSYFLTEARNAKKDKWYVVARDGGISGNEVLFKFLSGAGRFCHRETEIYTIISEMQNKSAALERCRRDFAVKIIATANLVSSGVQFESANKNLSKIRLLRFPTKISKKHLDIGIILIRLRKK